MGYLPKHIKVRRYNADVRFIAMAYLAGAQILKREVTSVRTPLIRYHLVEDGKASRGRPCRGHAACDYMWKFNISKMDSP